MIGGSVRWPLAAMVLLCACDPGMIGAGGSSDEPGFDGSEGFAGGEVGGKSDSPGGGDDDEDDGGTPTEGFPAAPDPLPTSFDPENLLTDEMVRGGEAITEAQMQDFLEQQGSYLAGYEDPASGDSAAELIVELSLDHGINPLYLVARIQTESSLITSGSSSHISAATGCGCPDGAACDPDLSGFAAQVDCAAVVMEEYFDELDADGETRSGWAVGDSKSTLDPCSIAPANRATAALYTYTPWVGTYADGCGRSNVGGSSLVALAYYRFWAEYDWGTDP